MSLPKIVIAGGTGFLGQLLASSLIDRGKDVILLSRKDPQKKLHGRVVFWNAKSLGDWVEEMEGAETLINLTGRSIDCRHNQSNRREILDSRIQSTRVLGEAILGCETPPVVWLNASSMALYGEYLYGGLAHDENAPIQRSGFLEEVTVAWEEEFFKFTRADVRQIAMRISFVLGRSSGAFPLLKKLTHFGLGGKQASGKQWMSWLHEDDWVGIVDFLINHPLISGPVNVTSPDPVQNSRFMKTMRSQFAPLGIGFPGPKLAVLLGCWLLGSAPELALQSRHVLPGVLQKKGYKFRKASLDEAIAALAKSS